MPTEANNYKQIIIVLAKAKVGQSISQETFMFYVYLIRSIKNSQKSYIGYTNNIIERIETHNSGGSVYTKSHRPWKLVMYLCFEDEAKAIEFEKYLKSGSGNSFAKKRFW